jgi:predicted secreted protein
MNWFSGVVLYILIWMLTLFAVLPIGTTPQADADAATGWRGAPSQVSMWRKVLITTIVAAILFAAAFVVIENDWLSFRHGILAGS